LRLSEGRDRDVGRGRRGGIRTAPSSAGRKGSRIPEILFVTNSLRTDPYDAPNILLKQPVLSDSRRPSLPRPGITRAPGLAGEKKKLDRAVKKIGQSRAREKTAAPCARGVIRGSSPRSLKMRRIIGDPLGAGHRLEKYSNLRPNGDPGKKTSL